MISITPVLEDYLEGILVIQNENKVVRVKDLVNMFKVKPPSVNEALSNLKAKKLVAQERYGYIELTKEGLGMAKRIYEKHNMLKNFLLKVLGVKETVAEQDACKIEHYLSKETMDKMVLFMKEEG